MEMVRIANQKKPSLKQILLHRFLSDDAKRLIFISSLYGLIHKDDNNYVLLRGLADINERLDITDHVSRLVFPAIRCRSCWNDLVLPKEQQYYENPNGLVQRVLQSAPWWMHYQSKEEMAADVRKILAKKPVFTKSYGSNVIQLY